MNNKRIGVLVPQAHVKTVQAALVNLGSGGNAPSFHIVPITPGRAAEDVALAVNNLADNATTSSTAAAATKEEEEEEKGEGGQHFSGFLNLCHGARGDGVSAAEVVDALEELQVPFYSGATPHSVKFNRSAVAALAFYAGEGNDDGFVVPCHGTISCCGSSAANATKMVDSLQLPVSVRPNKFLRSAESDGAIVANTMEERLAAQQVFFKGGHASVFVQEVVVGGKGAAGEKQQQQQQQEQREEVINVFLLCSAQWTAQTKRSAVSVLMAPIQHGDSEKMTQQVKQIGEKLFRGIFDDASCASTLRGHCLIHLRGEKQMKQQNEKQEAGAAPAAGADCGWVWRVEDIEPNCCLISPEDESVPSPAEQQQQQQGRSSKPTQLQLCRAFHYVLHPLMSNNTSLLSTFFSSLVGFDAPTRHVPPAFKVEYDPCHKWYGLTASRNISQGEIVFEDEATSFTLVTKPFVEKHWSDEMKVVFSRYAWPISGPEPTASGSSSLDQHVYAIWSDDPAKWRPINHHCQPNLHFAEPHSFNCVAARAIQQGEMLTLDYATFCDWTMKPFECKCGAERCRGLIEPTAEALSGYGPNAWHRMAPSRPLVQKQGDGK